MAKLKLFNTLTKKKEEFVPLHAGKAGIYTCGPTVYDFVHIGNLRAYFLADLLKRALQYNRLEVDHIMNITDIGQLTGDSDDSGEDKMVKAIKRENKPMTMQSLKEVGALYFEKFRKDFGDMNYIEPRLFTFASEHIKEQVEMIEELEKRGFTYKTSDGIYFDTSQDDEYGMLGGVCANVEHSRIGINKEKRNPEDFALWKFSDSKELGFPSPFGDGFPGWHIECSAMSMKYLGDQFDIHTGGVDLIPIHHNNEIAQSKAVSEKLLARYWIHNNHITVQGDKMAKSGDNFLTLAVIMEHGVSPMGLKLWFLQSKYSTRVDYSEEAIKASETAWKKFKTTFISLGQNKGRLNMKYKEKFTDLINDDLDTPQAVALAWELLRDEQVPNEDKRATLLDFDQVLGLRLDHLEEDIIEIPSEISELLKERAIAREAKDWIKADHLRTIIREHGYEVRDMDDKQIVTRTYLKNNEQDKSKNFEEKNQG